MQQEEKEPQQPSGDESSFWETGPQKGAWAEQSAPAHKKNIGKRICAVVLAVILLGVGGLVGWLATYYSTDPRIRELQWMLEVLDSEHYQDVDVDEVYADIYDAVNARVPFVQVSFVVETLDYLYKGGRCSSLARFGANLLKIRPSIAMSTATDGTLSSHKKYKGKMEQVVEKYCADTLAEYSNPDKSIGFVTYTSATEGMATIAKNALKEAGFKRILETRAGGTIATHCGPHTLGILYINDGGKT